MSDIPEPLKEHPSAYIVEDRSNQEEMERLELQDKMLTDIMGGVMTELPDPTQLRRVLDVGCGTGGWLMETAKAYPMIEKLIGVDISNKMLTYASAQAEKMGLAQRIQFLSMDALRILEFRPAYFDLVNQRMGCSWLRTWEWTKILIEYQRVCRPSGIIRITESSVYPECNSPALMQLWDILQGVLYHSGRLFSADKYGVIDHLAPLMIKHGIENVQTRAYSPITRTGTITGQLFYEDMRRMFRVLLPFLQKWTRLPKNFEEIYQQALKEIQQPDFETTGTLLTAWGTNSTSGKPMLIRGLM